VIVDVLAVVPWISLYSAPDSSAAASSLAKDRRDADRVA
jgi:hypothetical protein